MLAFLIPYYNHPKTICKLVEILLPYDLDIIIVDDGSDLESKEELHKINFNHPKLHLLERKNNGGKGAAIKDGISFANSLGFSHVFQIDADMQHDLDKIPLFLSVSKNCPQALICAQPKYDKNAPKSRLYGRKITNFWVFVNTLGKSLPDVMCGMRIYPVAPILPLLAKCPSQRMDFDPEILICAAKESLEFIWICVNIAYQKDGISHFKSLRDNLLISQMHARHFFALPAYIIKTLKKPKQTYWWERQERAGVFALNLTLFLVSILPRFLLDFCIRIVTFVYYLFSKDERKNLAEFYAHLRAFQNEPPLKFYALQKCIYQNFYHFGWAICDKMAVWKGKITHKNLITTNRVFMDKELRNQQRGQIILVSHYGNIEVARALSNGLEKFDITILVYQKNAMHFLNLINKVSQNKLHTLYIDTSNPSYFATIEHILERGGHLGIMGDRIAIKGTKEAKNTAISFLGKPCMFPQGAFLIAGLLKSKISLLWCEKLKNSYQVTLEPLCVNGEAFIKLGRNKEESIRGFMQKYVESLEKRVCKNPQFWFNFYDFWGQDVKQNL